MIMRNKAMTPQIKGRVASYRIDPALPPSSLTHTQDPPPKIPRAGIHPDLPPVSTRDFAPLISLDFSRDLRGYKNCGFGLFCYFFLLVVLVFFQLVSRVGNLVFAEYFHLSNILGEIDA